MRKHGLVFFIFLMLMAFGIWSLPKMNKDEFPQFTIRQGVVAAVYPGATAEEVEAQVTIPLEEYINTFEEVNKQWTYSETHDGIVYVYVMLRNSVKSNTEAWTKIRAGLDLLRKTRLPAGVLETVVIDDFGNTSSLLLAVTSPERSPRELEHYAKRLSERLRTIPETGRIRILGQQQEEIAVTIDPHRLAAYHIPQSVLQSQLALQGFRTLTGKTEGELALQVTTQNRTEYEILQQIVSTDPVSGAAVRLRDVATVERRYQTPDRYVSFNGAECLIVNIEMVPGNNIVAYGDEVERVMDEVRRELPPDVTFHRITDQPKVVAASVHSFLRDIVVSIIVVIVVMLLLFPLRTALVASTGVPVCTAICIGLMYLTGIELNTVTLAALIFVLGMIVDDSVIVIDGYTNKLEKGHSRWYSAAVSTSHLFVPMSLATCAISGMFFPMTGIITGPLGDFVKLFPFAVLFALTASIFYAGWVTPYLSTQFIHRQNDSHLTRFERGQMRFFRWLQTRYEQLLRGCFRRPAMIYTVLVLAIGVGVFLLTRLNLQLLPKAERECFAVEIHLREGASVRETAAVADSMAHVLRGDERVVSVTEFIGQASPRFHATYTPQMPGPNYAQFIVNTTSVEATAELLREYSERYEDAFPNAYIRFKQMDYQAAKNPLEVRFVGADADALELLSDTLKQYMSRQPEMTWVHTDYDAEARTTAITLLPDEAARLGVTETMLSLYLAQVTSGVRMTTVWESDYAVPVMLYTQDGESLSQEELLNLPVPTSIPGEWVPLRQVATLSPAWHHNVLEHRNGVRTVTVGCDLRGKTSQVDAERKVRRWIEEQHFGDDPRFADVEVHYGGLTEINDQILPQIGWSIVAALLVMFLLMLYHFGKVSLAILALSSSLLCIFGAMLGLWIFQLDISITAVLGVVSLIGIIVRNAIMMYEYAEMQRHRGVPVREAAFQAGLRRMRPVFLTSATTALGVLPMIIAHTSLWMPMGVVICFGTIFTLPLTVTILPVVYWRMYE
jgi:multidrug efflux pump subunit AcrB